MEKLLNDLKSDYNGSQGTNDIELPDNLSWEKALENTKMCFDYYRRGKQDFVKRCYELGYILSDLKKKYIKQKKAYKKSKLGKFPFKIFF